MSRVEMCHRLREPHEGHGDCPGVPAFGAMPTPEQSLGRLRAEEDEVALDMVLAMTTAADIAHRCFIENHLGLIADAQHLSADVVAISRWVTDSYPDDLSEELVVRRRCDKVAEEAGEVISALGGMYGENPRKGVTHNRDDVVKELLDTAAAALGAVYFMTDDDPIRLLGAHAATVWERAQRAGEEAEGEPAEYPAIGFHPVTLNVPKFDPDLLARAFKPLTDWQKSMRSGEQ